MLFAVSELAAEYESLNARSQGKEMVSSFNPKFSDVFINPDDDDVDPELVASLRSEIDELKTQVADLKSDKYEKLMEGDGSYGGLMFFAFLQEPHFEEKLSKIILDVEDLHASCHGSTSHVSFNELRSQIDHIHRLRVPLLTKLRGRYGKLHKKWSLERQRRMRDCGLSGGAGDLAAVCPICNLDKRNMKEDKREGTKELQGGAGGLTKKIERPVKMVETINTVNKLGKSWRQKSIRAKEERAKKRGTPAVAAPGGDLPPVSAFLPTPKRRDAEAARMTTPLAGTGAIGKRGGGKERACRKSREAIDMKVELAGSGGRTKSPTMFEEQTGWGGTTDEVWGEEGRGGWLGGDLSPLAVRLPDV